MDLDKHITTVSHSLRSSVLPIVESLVPAPHRPAALAKKLGIDKSLTGRIMRSVRSEDVYEIVHNAPAPHGLRIFLDAATDAGITEELRRRAEASVSEFESLIHMFPDGRSALEAAISDHIPEVRQRNERAAKQAVYKSMAYLLGYEVDASTLVSILSPDSDGTMVDTVHAGSLVQLRRLRGNSQFNLFGLRRYNMQPEISSWLETLDGRRDVLDINDYILNDFSTAPLPKLSIREEGDAVYTVLDADSLSINAPVTISNGWIARRSSLRYRSEDRDREWSTALLRIPARVRIQDYFIHKDIWPSPPEIQPRMHGLVTGSDFRKDARMRLDEIAMSTPVRHIGTGIDMPELRHQAVPRHREFIRHAFEQSGLNPADYRAYRCEVVYPVPFVSLTAWFDLPNPPESGG